MVVRVDVGLTPRRRLSLKTAASSVRGERGSDEYRNRRANSVTASSTWGDTRWSAEPLPLDAKVDAVALELTPHPGGLRCGVAELTHARAYGVNSKICHHLSSVTGRCIDIALWRWLAGILELSAIGPSWHHGTDKESP